MSRDSFNEATISGVRWVMLSRVVGETFAFVCIVLLARLVSPAEFGHAAVALIFVPLAGILTFEGFASALVQRETIDESHRQVATLMSLLGGLVLTLLVLALTPIAWRPIFGAQTAGLIALVSPVFLIASFGTVSRAMLWRKLDFRRMSLIEVAATAVGNVIPVGLALAGFGATAIVVGALAQTALTSVLLFAASPFPLPRWHWRSQRDIGGFGIAAALAGLVDVLFRNAGYGILAAQLPAAQVGIYYRAFNLGVIYQEKLSSVMMQLAFPVYSRTESRAEMRALHERASRVHAAVIFPLLASLIVLGPVLIPFVLGPAWTPSVRPAQILAVAGMVAAVLTGYPQVMLAVGRPRALLHFNVGMLAVYAVAIALAAQHGLIAVSSAVVVVYLIILVGVYRFLLQRHIGISVGRLLPEIGPAVAGCLALAAVGEPLRHLLEPRLGGFAVLAITGCAGLFAYCLALRLVSRATWTDLRTLAALVFAPLPMPRALRRRAAGAPAPATQP
ncbi:MAG TPA: oligosaccharide flippase family protein [Solirubrobacteraceae bacterium]|jgi:O-antigen/teichoic acid export membrane protein|nr:oligosaccharide flippase family protein [Solirubrobacteraceae bacterium]